MDDPMNEYMAGIETALSDLQVRVGALESVISQMHGASMQSDPSRLPVVVFENSPTSFPGAPDGDN